jgi:putative ATP-dependent endonuclease of OLD family
MTIKIETVRIAGFRGLSNVEVTLDRTTVLIGMNNAGKTSFLKALQIAFGDARFVSEDDFHIDAAEKTADKILIDVLMVPTDAEGKRAQSFDRLWGHVFRGGDPQFDSEGSEYVAFRSEISRLDDQKRFYPFKSFMKQWPVYESWQQPGWVGASRVPNLSEYIPFIFQDAQRDITDDLKLRTSPLGRVLSKVEYDEKDVAALQAAIDGLNSDAVDKSEVLRSLQDHLSELGHAVGTGAGKTEITPFANKVRDLTKGIRLNYQEGVNSFSMEYHGMGTRSWASLLVIKSMVKIQDAERTADNKAFLPILALEEPEAHLHPNAQKQLYHQMNNFPGQVIISTHSPYIAAQADIFELRSFYKTESTTDVKKFSRDLTPDMKRKIQREAIERQGDLLFSRILVLQEGQTESQLLPQMIEAVLGKSCAELGVSTVQVGSYTNYKPFLVVASTFDIPVIVYSDTDDSHVRTTVEKAVRELYENLNGPRNETVFLDSGKNLEQQLIVDGFRDEVVESLIRYKAQENPNERYRAALEKEYQRKSDEELLTEMANGKTTYSHFFGEVFMENPKNRVGDARFPTSIRTLCRKIETWRS